MNPNSTTLKESLESSLLKHSDHLAVVTDDLSLTYSQLSSFAEQLSAHLAQSGIVAGDRVGIVIPTSWQFVVATAALISREQVFLPLDPDVGADTFNYILENCRPKALVIDALNYDRLNCAELSKGIKVIRCDVRQLPGLGEAQFEQIVVADLKPVDTVSRLEPTDLVSVSFTSGSTGRPKGVMHSSASWLCGAMSTATYFGLKAGDTMLIGLPLAHTYAMRHLLAYLLSGGTLLLAREFLSAIQMLGSHHPQALLVVPSAINIILRAFGSKLADAAPHLQFISIGTAGIGDEQLEQLRLLVPNVGLHLPYGLTEARVGFLELSSPRSIKHVCDGISVNLVPASNSEPADSTGEIVISGPGLMLGYWGQSQDQEQALRERGFATGDMGRMEANGQITLLGRIDDMVNVGGEKVSPLEVETALLKYLGVLESAVFGIDDPTGLMGSQLVAVVVTDGGAELAQDDLRAYLMEHLEPHKVPKTITFEASLPKSSAGKVLKAKLKQVMSAGQS